MVRLADLDEPERSHLGNVPCHKFDTEPWVGGPPLQERRIAMVSTAALQHRDDTPFVIGAGDYRVISDDTPAKDLVMSHISTNFDRSGFEQDLNVVLPLDRLHDIDALSTGPIGVLCPSGDPVGYVRALSTGHQPKA